MARETGAGAVDPEIDILQNIHALSERIRQRDLARLSGLSLGMTNAVVKRLARKGWLTLRRIGSRNIRYIVSAKGLEQIARRSYRYFRTTVSTVVECRQSIQEFMFGIRTLGYRRVILVGASDLDFLVEEACRTAGMKLERRQEGESADRGQEHDVFLLYAEARELMEKTPRPQSGIASIQEVIEKKV